MTREMTEHEIRQVYAIAMAYDNRRLSEANITAWWEQSQRNRWTVDEAREAIHQHHAQSAEFLMPAHVTAIIRANRRQPETFDSAKLLPAAPPAQPERIKAIIAALAGRFHWDRDEAANAALDITCPYCHAGPRVWCTRLMTRGPHRGEHMRVRSLHPSRIAQEAP